MQEQVRKLLIKLGFHSSPNFLIIGAQKAGTTALHNILRQHSHIRSAHKKEIYFFNNDAYYNPNNAHQYHIHFPLPSLLKRNLKYFESTPGYLLHPKAAQRIHKYNPEMKLIILLRSPAERAFSAWTMYHYHERSKGLEFLKDDRSFTEAIDTDLQRFQNGALDENLRYYIERGLYLMQIKQFLNYFPEEQMLIIESNELKNQFENTSEKIQSFLEIPFEALVSIKDNVSKVNHKTIYEDDIKRLKAFYKPYNEALFEFLGKAYDWD